VFFSAGVEGRLSGRVRERGWWFGQRFLRVRVFFCVRLKHQHPFCAGWSQPQGIPARRQRAVQHDHGGRSAGVALQAAEEGVLLYFLSECKLLTQQSLDCRVPTRPPRRSTAALPSSSSWLPTPSPLRSSSTCPFCARTRYVICFLF